MNQPSSSLSLDLDKFSNSSDSLSECETLTVPDPNDPVTIRKFVDETVIGPISLQEQNIDHISAINTELHIGTVHKNIFHFHGNIKPPSQTNGERQQNGTDETHHLSDEDAEVVFSFIPRRKKSVFRGKPVIMSSAFLTLGLVVSAVCITVGFNKASPEDQKEQSTKLFSYPSNEYLSNSTEPPQDLWIIRRNQWQALDSLKPLPVNEPVQLVVIKHTGGASCTDFKTCSARVREIQKKDMEEYPDIRYNFLIGGDARIYEGRGWMVQNEGIRNESVDLAFIGNFTTDIPSEPMLRNAQKIIINGARIRNRKINFSKYNVVAHNHTELTDSPGQNIYKLLNNYFLMYSSAVCYNLVHGEVKITEKCPPMEVVKGRKKFNNKTLISWFNQ